MAQEYLCEQHTFDDLDITSKAQGAPGLDIDEKTLDGKRIIGGIKTNNPYKENDLGANQKNHLRKIFRNFLIMMLHINIFF